MIGGSMIYHVCALSAVEVNVIYSARNPLLVRNNQIHTFQSDIFIHVCINGSRHHCVSTHLRSDDVRHPADLDLLLLAAEMPAEGAVIFMHRSVFSESQSVLTGHLHGSILLLKAACAYSGRLGS